MLLTEDFKHFSRWAHSSETADFNNAILACGQPPGWKMKPHQP